MILSPQPVRPGNPKRWFAAAVAITVLSMAGALYFQYVLDLAPCPLCVLQRVAIIAVGLIALAGLLATRPTGQLAASLLAAPAALAGTGIAAWHSWIVAFPPASMSCGRPFEWFHEDFPLTTWLPKLFRGDGDCLAIDWTFAGLTIPNLSLLAFLLLVGLTAAATRSAWQRLR